MVNMIALRFGVLVLLLSGIAVCNAQNGSSGTSGPAPAADHSKDTAWALGDRENSAETNSRGEHLFRTVCAVCHEHGVGHAPSVYILTIMTPASIYNTLTSGAMRIQAQHLSDDDRRAVAQYLAGSSAHADQQLKPPPCRGAAARFDYHALPSLSGWGVTSSNARYIDEKAGGLTRQNVGRLRLKWAVGFADAVRARSQPAIAGGAIYVGSQGGVVYALDGETGCERWEFQATAEVRTAIVVAPWKQGSKHVEPQLYFGDIVGNVYAVNAVSGALVWRDRTDAHPSTTLTATPVLYRDVLYVPVSSLEEGIAGDTYPCCNFRGSLIAYDARTGVRRWQRYMVESAKRQGSTAKGVEIWGPAGIGLWNSPAVDEQRGRLYLATGDNYSQPTTELSDSIMALDIKTGDIVWSYQATINDAWNAGCVMKGSDSCPKPGGPDADFGAAAILTTTRDGRQLVVAGQKSGWVYALDPRDGKLVWKKKIGRGGIVAGIYFGMAAHDGVLYVPINDGDDAQEHTERARPGLYAIDLATGDYLWQSPIPDDVCTGRGPRCGPGIAAPVTLVGSLVISGASDGRIRILDVKTGSLAWQFDTATSFKTVGGGEAAGGSMGGGAGPIAGGGSLIVESGYGFSGRMPGNVMLVFGID